MARVGVFLADWNALFLFPYSPFGLPSSNVAFHDTMRAGAMEGGVTLMHQSAEDAPWKPIPWCAEL